MPKRDQLISELQGEQDYGVLLVAQMGGVPNELQLIVETANKAGGDPWVTIPWNADDDYITRFATYVRDNLASGHQVYVEVGNEVWNGGSPIATTPCAIFSRLVQPGNPAFQTSTGAGPSRSRSSNRQGHVSSSRGASRSNVVEPPAQTTRRVPGGFAGERSGER